MFRNSRKVLGSLACAAFLVGANPNSQVEAGAGAKIASGAIGTVLLALGATEILQGAGFAVNSVKPQEGDLGDEKGLLGLHGTVGRFLGRPGANEQKGDNNTWKAFLAGSVKAALGVGGIVAGIIG